MKYLRLFNNDADYQAFIGGGDYIEPHIVGVNNNSDKPTLKFKKETVKKIITFYLGSIDRDKNIVINTTYQCEEGMTFYDFVKQGLDTNERLFNTNIEYVNKDYSVMNSIGLYTLNGEYIYYRDIIIDNAYYLIDMSSYEDYY
jgi:hypothetical protein